MDAETIKRSLEGSGLRCTPQRYAVMAFLMEHNGIPRLRKSSKRESHGSALFKGHDL
jgi:Fe2+ or Zn2+ uptake regulation protein